MIDYITHEVCNSRPQEKILFQIVTDIVRVFQAYVLTGRSRNDRLVEGMNYEAVKGCKIFCHITDTCSSLSF